MHEPVRRRPRRLVGRRGGQALCAAIGLLVGGNATSADDRSPPPPPNWSDRKLQDLPLLLAVVINGHARGLVGDFRQRGDTLYSTRRELTDLGLKPGPGDPEAWIPLASLGALSYRVDLAAQTVSIDASSDKLEPTLLSPRRASAQTRIDASSGAVLDYDVVGDLAGGRAVVAGLLDARVFSPWGVISSSTLARLGRPVDAIRLDSTYTYSDPDNLRRVRVGDLISSGLAWTRPLRLGGAQFARDFTLRPDLVTFPVPSIAGEVAVPSTVDVLVNGVQQLSAVAPPGPFELRQLPIVTGANDVSLIVNNALGQSVSQTLPIYASNAMLAAGLDAFSVEAGAVRLGYGVRSDDYRDVAGSASYRRGLADWLTLSGHAEAAPEVALAGAGVSMTLFGAGVVSAAVAGSTGRGRHGMQGFVALERITRGLSMSASMQWTQGDFRDVASLFADPVPKSQIQANIGAPLGNSGSIGLSFTRQRRSVLTPLAVIPIAQAPEPLEQPALALPLRVSLLSASYSVPLFDRKAMFYATAFHDFDNRANTGCIFGISVPIGVRGSADASASVTNGQFESTLEASQSVSEVGQSGGQAVVGEGRPSRLFASAEHEFPWGLVSAGVDRTSGQTAWRGTASGALVLADNNVFASNAIPDSFAIVNTDGAEGVPVLYENRLVETTGKSGQVLIPNLRSFESNKIAIDPTFVPVDADIGDATRLVRPQDRSGVVVHFPIVSSHAALLRLVDGQGAPLPIGTHLKLEPDGAETVVGFDGEAFVRGLGPHSHLLVNVPDRGSCEIAPSYHPETGSIPTIGPLRCDLGPKP